MSLPITSRVKRAGHQGCGCGCGSAAKKSCKSMAKKIDAMYNGIPGVQKDDFKQFS